MATDLVYSTDSGRMCPSCRQALSACSCALQKKAELRGDGQVRVRREVASRGGKTVTVVRGLALTDDQISALGKRLRSACGTGGTAKDGLVEVQGDHVDRVLAVLAKDGISAKRGGG
jgi:translation initiation factor 1